jgi:hypothetical protein
MLSRLGSSGVNSLGMLRGAGCAGVVPGKITDLDDEEEIALCIPGG